MNEQSGQNPQRLLFVGCGSITRTHSRTLASVAPGLPRFYASRDGARARAYCERFGGAGWFDSYEAALADARMTVALIATPPVTHFELTFAALAAGHDVIVEKPAFLRSADCELVRDAARAAGRRVLVAENYHYKPLAEHLRRIIADETLGEVRVLQINALRSQPPLDWRGDADVAGGALVEGGIHWISLMADLGLAIRRVTGCRAGRSTDLTWLVTIEYANGTVGQLGYSWEIPSPLRGLRLSALYGTQGTATFETNGLFLLERGRRRRLLLPELEDIRGYRAMFRDFLDALRTDHDARYTLQHAWRDLALVEEIQQSNESPWPATATMSG